MLEMTNYWYMENRVFPGGSAVKNPPAMQEMQETRVRSLGWEDPLEKEMATTSVFLPGKSYGWVAVHRIAKSQT